MIRELNQKSLGAKFTKATLASCGIADSAKGVCGKKLTVVEVGKVFVVKLGIADAIILRP